MSLTRVAKSTDNGASAVISSCTFNSLRDGRMSFPRRNKRGNLGSVGSHRSVNGRENNESPLLQNVQRDFLDFKRGFRDLHFGVS